MNNEQKIHLPRGFQALTRKRAHPVRVNAKDTKAIAKIRMLESLVSHFAV